MELYNHQLRKAGGVFGLSSVVTFMLALGIIGYQNESFSFVSDFVSKLGASNEPNAVWWNVFGFAIVGGLQIGFGIVYGLVHRDQLTAILLAFFGVGFIFAAIPFDLDDPTSLASKAHFVAVCFALGFWLIGLSRISSNQRTNQRNRLAANVAAIAIVLAIIGLALGMWSMPITHRLVFFVVFSWTVFSSIYLLRSVTVAPK